MAKGFPPQFCELLLNRKEAQSPPAVALSTVFSILPSAQGSCRIPHRCAQHPWLLEDQVTIALTLSSSEKHSFALPNHETMWIGSCSIWRSLHGVLFLQREQHPACTLGGDRTLVHARIMICNYTQKCRSLKEKCWLGGPGTGSPLSCLAYCSFSNVSLPPGAPAAQLLPRAGMWYS